MIITSWSPFGVQYFLSKAGGAKSSQKFQFCLCVSVYPCNQLQDLQTFVAYTNWLFIFCKKEYLQTKNVFLRKSQVFVSSARVTVVDHAWWWWWFVAFYENLKRNRVSVRTLFLYSKKQKLLKKKDQWMEVDDLWEAMKMWLLLRNFKLYVL